MTHDDLAFEAGEPSPGVSGLAEMSASGLYRYRLVREWEPLHGRLTFIMLNPSTASGVVDDPTIVRCSGFARREGFGGLEVVNLYAFRATKPVDLWRAEDPIGPLNNRYVEAALSRSPVVCAWGANAKPDRVAWLLRRAAARNASGALHALRQTKAGAPGHPLYLPANAPLARWPAPVVQP